MNNYIKQTHHFLLQLITLYSSISELLNKIPISSSPKTQTLRTLTDTVTACNCLDRGIKRQHELRLFRQTHAILRQYVQKPGKVKKIDIVIKFSLVSQVMCTRLKQQLITSQHLKKQILQQIESQRLQFLKWAEQKKVIKAAKENKKQTQSYVVKFVFTEMKPNDRPSPTAITLPDPANRNHQSQKVFLRQSPLTKHLSSAPTNYKNRNSTSRLVRQSTKRNTEQRKLLYLERPTFPSTKIKQCIQTQISPSEIPSNDTIVPTGMPIEQQVEVEHNNKNLQHKFKKKSKYLTIDSNLAIKDSEGQQQNKQPNSEFYVSQRYLKSRKTIESASHFSSKIKKRSGFGVTNGLNECQSSIQEQLQQEQIIFRPSNFKPRQFQPRFVNQTDNKVQKIKSEKNLQKKNDVQQTHIHKVLRRSQKLGTNSKRRSSLRSKTSMLSSRTKKENIELKKSQFFNLSILRLDGETSVPVDQRREEKALESNIKPYYSQLNCMRSDILSSCDSWLKDFSVFFWHQDILSEERSRSIQRILEGRKSNYPVGQFDLKFECSQRHNSQNDAIQADAFIQAVKCHLSECKELGQGGPHPD